MADLHGLVLRYVAGRVARHELAASNAPNVRWVLLYFAAACPDDPRRLRRHHVETWLDAQRVAASTLRTRLSIVRTFCRWLVLASYVRQDPTAGIQGPRNVRHLPRALPREHVGATFGSCPDTRARLIVSLEVQEALRRAEVARLQMADVDLRQRLLFVRGKGDAQRFVAITDETLRVLSAYLAEHAVSAGPLIRSRSNPSRGVSPATIGRIVSRAMWDAGIKRRAWDGVSGHALRHTAASDMLDEGADVRQVQGVLGHGSLLTTQRYLRRIDAASLLPVMNGRRYTTT